MEYLSREEIMNDYNRSLELMMEKYQIEDIGIYEEEGEGDSYYFGYTVRKNGKVYMINLPYVKNKNGELAIEKQVWTLQEEDSETKGYRSLDEIFDKINYLH